MPHESFYSEQGEKHGIVHYKVMWKGHEIESFVSPVSCQLFFENLTEEDWAVLEWGLNRMLKVEKDEAEIVAEGIAALLKSIRKRLKKLPGYGTGATTILVEQIEVRPKVKVENEVSEYDQPTRQADHSGFSVLDSRRSGD